MRKLVTLITVAVSVFLFHDATALVQTSTQPPPPVDAVQGILAAYSRHSVVIIGERHWLRQAGDFYIRLVREPSFAQSVHNIVVEFASRQNQPLLDRYIAGEDVPADQLRRIWRDTTKVGSWESPIYAEWLAAIREVNKRLPRDRRLRVLAGDTAVDWNRIHTHDEWLALGDNNISITDVIVNEVLRKKQRALVVLGSNHMIKSGDRNGGPNVTTRLESQYPGSTYIVLMLNARTFDPSIEAQLKLPKAEAPALYDIAGTAAAGIADQNGAPLIKKTDALLYLMPPGMFSEVAYPPASFEPAYVKELDRRSLIEWGELRIRKVLGLEPPWRELASSPRMEALRRQFEAGDKSATAKFWEEMKIRGTPLVERVPDDPAHVLVTFLYRAETPTKAVVLMAQLYDHDDRDDSRRLMVHLSDTDVWYKTYWIRDDMRFTYSLVPNPTAQSLAYNSELQLQDRFNPKTVSPGTHVGKSVVELPAAPAQTWIAPNPRVGSGKLEEVEFESKVLSARRRFWVYTPAGYDPKRESPYPMLICFDGWTYSRPEFVPTPTILDNLIASGKIPPVIAVFIDQAPQPQRNVELTNNQEFLDFVVNELLPVVHRKVRATSAPSQTVVCGSSTGGLAGAFFAFRRPDVFGNVLSQSGAFWPGKDRSDAEHEWLTRQIQSAPRVAVRFVLQVGVLETGGPTPFNGPNILTTNRRLRDVLLAKGYELRYDEVAGGHEPISWRGGIAEALIYLFNPRSRS